MWSPTPAYSSLRRRRRQPRTRTRLPAAGPPRTTWSATPSPLTAPCPVERRRLPCAAARALASRAASLRRTCPGRHADSYCRASLSPRAPGPWPPSSSATASRRRAGAAAEVSAPRRPRRDHSPSHPCRLPLPVYPTGVLYESVRDALCAVARVCGWERLAMLRAALLRDGDGVTSRTARARQGACAALQSGPSVRRKGELCCGHRIDAAAACSQPCATPRHCRHTWSTRCSAWARPAARPWSWCGTRRWPTRGAPRHGAARCSTYV